MTAINYLCAASAAALIMSGAAFAKKGDEEAVAKAMADSYALWLACDIDGAAAFETADHSAYYPDSSDLQISSAEERDAEKQFCADGGRNEASYELKGVIVLGDAAVAHGSGHYKRTEPDGAVSIDGDYTFSDVFVRTKDGWKVRHSHVSAVMGDMTGDMMGDEPSE